MGRGLGAALGPPDPKQSRRSKNKKWVAVCPDPVIDTIPIEALVPGDAKSDNWRTLPYLMQRFAVGRLPTSSLVARAAEPPHRGMDRRPLRRGRLGRGQAGVGPPARAGVRPAGDGGGAGRTERAGRVQARRESSADGAESAPDEAPAHHGLRPRGRREPRLGWAPPTPAVVCVLDPRRVEGRRRTASSGG